MAILDEPPFCWLDANGAASGCDVEVASTVLRRAGIRLVDVQQVTFAELIPGVVEGRWHLNTGMFITDARRLQVRYTRPIWAAPDGLIVRRADDRRFSSYQDLGIDPNARLGVVVGQVQGDSARQAGVPDQRLVSFTTQDDAVRAALRGVQKIFLVGPPGDPRLVAVDLPRPAKGRPRRPPVGAFSLSHEQTALADVIDAQLAAFIGSPQHRAIMTRQGFTSTDIDAIPGG